MKTIGAICMCIGLACNTNTKKEQALIDELSKEGVTLELGQSLADCMTGYVIGGEVRITTKKEKSVAYIIQLANRYNNEVANTPSDETLVVYTQVNDKGDTLKHFDTVLVKDE